MSGVGFDPRPRVVEESGVARLLGSRCTACGHVLAFQAPRCPLCRGPLAEARFGPDGSVWSATVVRVAVPGREPPYGLAYVDLDAGPRVLAHYRPAGDRALRVGARVRLRGCTPQGDPAVEERR